MDTTTPALTAPEQQALIDAYQTRVPLGMFHEAWFDFEAWCQAGDKIMSIDRIMLWILGEWLRFGEEVFGEAASQMFPTSYQASTCRQARWMVDRVPLWQRRYDVPTISYSHHLILAACDEDTRTMWLDWIERQGVHGVSVAHLRSSFHKYALPPDTPEGRALLDENHKKYIDHKREMDALGLPVDMQGVPPLLDEAAAADFDWDHLRDEPAKEKYILPAPVFLMFVECIDFLEKREGMTFDRQSLRRTKDLMAHLAAECRKHMEQNITKPKKRRRRKRNKNEDTSNL